MKTSLQKDLETLIRFKTVTGNAREIRQALAWIKQRLKEYPLHVHEFESKGFPSLVATTQKIKKPKVFLAAHLDVVPGSKQCFVPRVRDEKLFGRGTFDMKFAIACYLDLLERHKNHLKEQNFGIMITTDEEIGGYNGTKFLVKSGYSSDIVFLPDGGYNGEIEKKVKGVLHLEIESRGKSAHGSRPWEGDDAFWKLYNWLVEFKKHFTLEPCGNSDHYHNTITIGKIEGGKATNQLPDSVKAFVDIRYVPSLAKTFLIKELNRLKKKFGNVSVRELVSGESYEMKRESPEILEYKRIVKSVKGIVPRDGFSHGASDARFFRSRNIPVLVTRPMGGGAHTEAEWISISDLQRFSEILNLWVASVA